MKLKKNINKNIEDKELLKIQRQKEMQSLLFETEAKIPKKNIDREIEKFELRNGKFISKKQAEDYIIDLARKDVDPMFPNSKPFFKLIYKLCEWDNLDPNKFTKPPVVAKWIKQYIYGRFDIKVLPTLLAKDNPIMTGYIKKYKLYQFLNDDGLIMLENYIDEAIEVMKLSNNWYDFEKKYTSLYDLPLQLKINLKK